MFRALRFVIIAALILVLVWWIASIPGTFTAHSGKITVTTSVPFAIFLWLIIAALVTILLRVIGGLRRAPGGITRWRGGRRKQLGEAATQRGIVALSAGDAKAAEIEAQRAKKLLGETPLVLLLTAESARLAGKPDEAKTAFEKLTQDKTMAFLGHRGLLRHHAAAGDHDAADLHAAKAESAYPGAAWLKTQRFGLAIKKQDFSTALGHTTSKPEIAALATGAARAATTDRDALAYAKQAIKADPTLAPAAVTYATILRKLKRNRAAKKSLLNAWKILPHPEIAAAYLENVSAPIERAQAAADLAKAKPGHPESELILAQTSLDAKLTGEAKRHAEAAIAAGLTDKRPYAVLAALDEPNAKAALAAAMQPVWSCTACFTAHDTWSPACPNCAKPGTLIWKTAQTKALAAA
jgi:HemY protein